MGLTSIGASTRATVLPAAVHADANAARRPLPGVQASFLLLLTTVPTSDQTAGQPALDLYDFLKDETDYDVDLIWDAILPNYNIDDIRKALHLDYVLPTVTR